MKKQVILHTQSHDGNRPKVVLGSLHVDSNGRIVFKDNDESFTMALIDADDTTSVKELVEQTGIKIHRANNHKLSVTAKYYKCKFCTPGADYYALLESSVITIHEAEKETTIKVDRSIEEVNFRLSCAIQDNYQECSYDEFWSAYYKSMDFISKP